MAITVRARVRAHIHISSEYIILSNVHVLYITFYHITPDRMKRSAVLCSMLHNRMVKDDGDVVVIRILCVHLPTTPPLPHTSRAEAE